jgi:uncharacterized protein YjeT (DUF2065 family)
MDLVNQYPNQVAIAAGVLLIVENILPYLPIKANSTVQLIINVAKAILRK